MMGTVLEKDFIALVQQELVLVCEIFSLLLLYLVPNLEKLMSFEKLAEFILAVFFCRHVSSITIGSMPFKYLLFILTFEKNAYD